MQINVQLKGLTEISAKLASLGSAQQASAYSMAINKVAAKGMTDIKRAITERYQIKAADVSAAMSLRGATGSTLQATISIFGSQNKKGRSLNMIHFVEKKVSLAQGRKRVKDGTQNQLRFKILKSSGLKTIAGDPGLKNGAFIGNKGRTVFQRTGSARLPIKPVQVIGVGQMFNFKPIHERVRQTIEEEFLVEINRAIDQKLR